jgi:hypothetical protein
MTYNFENRPQAAAIQVLVDLEVLRWGEAERVAATQRYRNLSRGLAINTASKVT